MKLHLILPLITCGAGLALSPSLQAQSTAPEPTTSGTCPQCIEGKGGPGCHGGHHFGRGPGGGPGETLQKLTADLSLTADQQAAVKPILDALHAQNKAIHEDNSLTKEQKWAKAKDAREAANGQINGLLTPAQQQQFAALKEKRHHEWHKGGEAQPAASSAATP